MSMPNFFAVGPSEVRRESELAPEMRNSIAVSGKEAVRWMRSMFPPVEAMSVASSAIAPGVIF